MRHCVSCSRCWLRQPMCWDRRRCVRVEAWLRVEAPTTCKLLVQQPVTVADPHVHVMLCVVVDDSISSEYRREVLEKQQRTAAAVTVQVRRLMIQVGADVVHRTAICAWLPGTAHKGTAAGCESKAAGSGRTCCTGQRRCAARSSAGWPRENMGLTFVLLQSTRCRACAATPIEATCGTTTLTHHPLTESSLQLETTESTATNSPTPATPLPTAAPVPNRMLAQTTS